MERMSLLRGEPYEVNQYITIYQPTLGQIEKYGETKYLQLVTGLTATSYQYRFWLDDLGIDYEDVDDYTMFCMIAPTQPLEATEILFGDLDFTRLKPMTKNGEDIVLRDDERNINVDPVIYELIVAHLRQLHGFEREYKVAGNKTARKYYMQEERRILEEKAKKQKDEDSSIYAPLINALVNCSEFKYDYTTVWDMPIYTLMESMKQVQRIINYKNLMMGIYTGNVDASKISKKDKTWIGE